MGLDDGHCVQAVAVHRTMSNSYGFLTGLCVQTDLLDFLLIWNEI